MNDEPITSLEIRELSLPDLPVAVRKLAEAYCRSIDLELLIAQEALEGRGAIDWNAARSILSQAAANAPKKDIVEVSRRDFE